MRTELRKEAGNRKKFRGTFIRIGKKAGFNGYSQETILLKDIADALTGEQVTDHIWLNFTKGFENIHLQPGTIVEFQARIVEYKKGYKNSRFASGEQKKDYKLSHPTQIRIVT